MKTRIAFALCLGVCSLSVLLPLGIFYIQDSVANSDPRWVQVNCGLTHKF